MQLSIIIPVLNEAARISELVAYLHRHGGAALREVLVADGGSTDDSCRQAAGAGAKVLNCEVSSRAAQMNAGARAAEGDILYFVHADTRPPVSFADDIRRSLEAGYAMGCYRYRFDSPNPLLKINAFFNRFHWLWCQGGDKTFYIRRDLFFQFGGYDEYYTIMEEYDFLRRAMPQHPLHIIPKYAVVSSRKYEEHSWLRVQFANAVVFNMFRKGASPDSMRDRYRKLLS
ncbi:MAG: TIGR04283 family arsenosugar biosynthesis glycosyltransferase [Saprospiraceae bacterium]